MAEQVLGEQTQGLDVRQHLKSDRGDGNMCVPASVGTRAAWMPGGRPGESVGEYVWAKVKCEGG